VQQVPQTRQLKTPGRWPRTIAPPLTFLLDSPAYFTVNRDQTTSYLAKARSDAKTGRQTRV